MPVLKDARLGAIVVVEDDPDDAFFLKCELRKKNVLNPLVMLARADQLFAYLDGRDVYADRSKFPYPILVILDLRLPVSTGFEAQAWMKLKPKHRDIPIIVISGSDNKRSLNEAVASGASYAMVKPFKAPEFFQVASNLQVPIQCAENHLD